MEVSDISSVTTAATANAGASASDLNDQFLKLLVTQLKNQDPLDPLKNEDFVAQLAQLQTLDQSIKMAETNQAILLQSSLSTGSSLIGKEVSGLINNGDSTEEVTGIMRSIKVEGGNVVYSLVTDSGAVRNIQPSDIVTVKAPETQE